MDPSLPKTQEHPFSYKWRSLNTGCDPNATPLEFHLEAPQGGVTELE